MLTAIKKQFVISDRFKNKLDNYHLIFWVLLCLADAIRNYFYETYIMMAIFSFLGGMFLAFFISKIRPSKNACLETQGN